MVNRKRKSSLIVLMLVFILILTGCQKKSYENEVNLDKGKEIKQEENIKIKVGSLNGPTTAGLSKMIVDEEKEDDYKFTIYKMPEELIADISKGEIDLAAIPVNLASTLYNKTDGKVQVAAVNTLGVLKILGNNNEIKKPEDLEGKTIYTIGKGITPEIILNDFIKSNNLKNVNVEYKNDPKEIAALLNKEENILAVLPEPFSSILQVKNENIKTLFDLNDEWKKNHGEQEMITGVLVGRKEFIEKNKDEFEEFLEDYEESIDYVSEDIKGYEALEKVKLVPEGLGKKVIKNLNIKYIDGQKMKSNVSEYLEFLYEYNKELIGGKLPDEGFYYEK